MTFAVRLRISFVASSAVKEVTQEKAKQLSFDWTGAELPSREAMREASATPSAASVAQREESGLLNTSSRVGFPESSSRDQLSKAVNRALAELEDSGRIQSVESDSGDLRFTCLAVPERASAHPLPSDANQASKTLPASLTRPVVEFCQKIIERLTNRPAPAHVQGDATSQLKWKLRALWAPFSEADEDGAAGYQWPASRLTGDDMIRLRVLANLSGLPCNEVLRVAAGVLFDQTRMLIDAAVPRHEENQTPVSNNEN